MAGRQELLLAAERAGSLAEIEELRGRLAAFLADEPDDREVALAAQRLAALGDALEAIGLTELPPSTGAR